MIRIGVFEIDGLVTVPIETPSRSRLHQENCPSIFVRRAKRPTQAKSDPTLNCRMADRSREGLNWTCTLLHISRGHSYDVVQKYLQELHISKNRHFCKGINIIVPNIKKQRIGNSVAIY
jgi:hypothetical protein